MILYDGHFTFKNNDILESDRFLYRINIFNGRWLVTVTSLLSNIYKSRIIYSYTLQWGFLINTNSMLANVYGRLSAAEPSAAGPSATIEHSSIYIYTVSMWPRFARQKYIF